MLASRYIATGLLTALNTAVYLTAQLGGDTTSLDIDCASPRLWQPLSYMFSHREVLHFAVNMLVLIMAGAWLEARRGALHVLAVYTAGGLAGGLLFMGVCHMAGIAAATLAGASAATLALCGATITSAGRLRERLHESPALGAAVILALAVTLWGLRNGNPGGSVAHIGGIAAGCVAGRWRRKPAATSSIDPLVEEALRSGYQSLSAEQRRRISNQTTGNGNR